MIVVTETQYMALVALASCGTMKRAAYTLDISRAAFDWRLRKVRKRTGLTMHQLMHRLGAGSVLIQDEFWRIAA